MDTIRLKNGDSVLADVDVEGVYTYGHGEIDFDLIVWDVRGNKPIPEHEIEPSEVERLNDHFSNYFEDNFDQYRYNEDQHDR